MDANSDYENSSSSSEDDSFNASFFKKSKNKRGRRAKWEDKFVNDMVDVHSFFFIRNYLSVEPSKFLKKVPSPALKVS